MRFDLALMYTIRAVVWGVGALIITTAAYASVWFWWAVLT